VLFVDRQTGEIEECTQEGCELLDVKLDPYVAAASSINNKGTLFALFKSDEI
jgi:hypothetical protein